MDREQMTPAIRVAVAAPFAMIVSIHGRAAEYADEIDFCGATSDASRVLEQIGRLQPEVLLLSEDLGFDDADFFAQLTAAAPTTRLVMLVGGDPSAAQSFADVVIGRDAIADDLRVAIVTAARRVEAHTAPPAHSRARSTAEGDRRAEDAHWSPEVLHQDGQDTVSQAETATMERRQADAHELSPSIAAAPEPAPASAAEPPADAAGGGQQRQGPSVARGSIGEVSALAERLGRLVLVFSGKGGVGKSVVATNLATALTVGGARVALVDLNLQYGDAGVLLHLETHSTTIDAVAGVASSGQRLDAAVLDAAMATTPEGLRVLLAPRSPEFADLVTAEALGAILTELGRVHEYVVVDSPAHLEERILGVMEVADQILLVTSSNITAVKDTKMTLRLLQSLGIESGRVALVLNQTRSRIGFAAHEVERALRFPLLANLPHDQRMDDSLDSGRPLILSEPRSPFGKQLQLVVDHLGRELAASAVQPPQARPAKWRLRFGQR